MLHMLSEKYGKENTYYNMNTGYTMAWKDTMTEEEQESHEGAERERYSGTMRQPNL